MGAHLRQYWMRTLFLLFFREKQNLTQKLACLLTWCFYQKFELKNHEMYLKPGFPQKTCGPF